LFYDTVFNNGGNVKISKLISLVSFLVLISLQTVEPQDIPSGSISYDKTNKILYRVGGRGGLGYSTNNGNSWVSINAGLIQARKAILKTETGDLLICGYKDQTNSIFRSTNLGSTWINVLNVGAGIFAFKENSKGHVFGISQSAIYKSTDDGMTWISSSLPSDARSIFIDKNDKIFVGGDCQIFISIDDGSTWSTKTQGLTDPYTTFYFGTIASNSMNTVITTSDGSMLFVSKDDGETWEKVSSLGTTRSVGVTGLGSLLVCGDNGTFRSTDSGQHWSTLPQVSNKIIQFESGDTYEVFFLEKYDEFMTEVYPGNLYYSYDDGLTASLTPRTILLNSPNGSETWQAGTTQNITWTSTNVTNVKLEYTTNSGTNWATIIASTPASSGSYAWTIPNTESMNCKVKISDVDNSATSDVSDNVFTIIGMDSITYGGKVYHTVKIGTQTWLKENLDIGTMIQGNANATNNVTIEKYCYDNISANCDTYGGLYQWNEAMAYTTTPGTQGICPTGWHVPTKTEFETLKVAVNNDGNALKAIGQGNGIGSGTNTSGFSGLLAGYRNNYNNFLGLGLGYIWSSTEATEFNATYSYYLHLRNNDSGIYFYYDPKAYGFSIRCLKDENPIASIQIVSPNGGESFVSGTIDSIKWTSTNITNVKLEYSTDSGTNWSTIIASTSASSGSYAWTIPNAPSTQCKVRATDVNNAALFDVSDTTFTISDGNWTVYNTSNSSLLHNSIKAIAVDNAGTKWIGTENGLAKFDGTNWTIYTTSNSSLPYNYVSSIAIDAAGNKWVGTFSRYLAKFDNVNWTVYNTNDWGLPLGAIQAIAIDASGNKWIGTSEGLAKFDGTTGTIYTPSNSGLPYKAVQSIAIDEQGNKWIGTLDSGLVKFDGTNWTVYKTANSQIPNNQVHAIAISRYGNKWLGTTGGFARYDGSNWNVYDRSADYLDNWVFATAIDNSGNKWTGSMGGVGVFDGTNWTSYSTTNSGLPDSRINAIAIDGSGNKWFGTNAGGVAVLKAGTTVSKTLSLLSPNSGETWQAGSTQNITWTSSNVTNVKLEYSKDNGSTWTTVIASASAGSGNYAWTVPGVSSTNCKVRISDASNSDLTDKSDNVFTISKVISPPANLIVSVLPLIV